MFLRCVTFLGSGWMLLALVFVLLSPRWRLEATAGLATVLATSLAVAWIKILAGRARPCHAVAWVHGLALEVPRDCSFPSGHAAGSFAFACFVLTLHRRAGVAALAVATAVAISRVALGVHYPTDVVAGALFGAVMGFSGAQLYGARTRRLEG